MYQQLAEYRLYFKYISRQVILFVSDTKLIGLTFNVNR